MLRFSTRSDIYRYERTSIYTCLYMHVFDRILRNRSLWWTAPVYLCTYVHICKFIYQHKYVHMYTYSCVWQNTTLRTFRWTAPFHLWIYVNIYTYMYIYKYINTQILDRAPLCATSSRLQLSTCVYTYKYMYTHVHISIHTHTLCWPSCILFICVHIYINVHVFIYIHIYGHICLIEHRNVHSPTAYVCIFIIHLYAV